MITAIIQRLEDLNDILGYFQQSTYGVTESRVLFISDLLSMLMIEGNADISVRL